MAAHAGAPYTNVDSRSDRGNDIGDSQIEGLNQSQLDQNYGVTLSGPAVCLIRRTMRPKLRSVEATPIVVSMWLRITLDHHQVRPFRRCRLAGRSAVRRTVCTCQTRFCGRGETLPRRSTRL